MSEFERIDELSWRLKYSEPGPERIAIKAQLIREVAVIAFGPEALSLEAIHSLLEMDENRFLVGLDDAVAPGDREYGCASAVAGAWPLTLDTLRNFWEVQEVDWDDLDDASFASIDASGEASRRHVGVNVIISVRYLAGDNDQSGLKRGDALTLLASHIRRLVGPIDLANKGSLPVLITTVEKGTPTWRWAGRLGMTEGVTTNYGWTKYRIALDELDHLTAEQRRHLDRFIELVNAPETIVVY